MQRSRTQVCLLKSCCGNTQTDGRTDTTDRLVRSVTVVHDLVVFLSGVSGESTDHRSLLVDVADDAIDDVVQAVGHSELQRRLIDQLRSLQTSTSHTLDSLRSTVLPPGESPVFVDVANNAVDDVVDAVRDTELQRRNIDQLLSLHTALRCTSHSHSAHRCFPPVSRYHHQSPPRPPFQNCKYATYTGINEA